MSIYETFVEFGENQSNPALQAMTESELRDMRVQCEDDDDFISLVGELVLREIAIATSNADYRASRNQ